MRLPQEPMIPVHEETIPVGDDWGYQLKWDGVRILARIDNGAVELYSRNMLRKDTIYPEVVRELAPKPGRFLLDGEIVYFDLGLNRPSFSKVLQRERSRSIGTPSHNQGMICYVLFDLLFEGETDLRERPYQERYDRLKALFPSRTPTLFVTDMFSDGTALWQWVETHQWEGIVSKRLSGTYREGKKHRDWLKKKTALLLEISIVGVNMREGRVASLVMAQDGIFFGKVSLGLNERTKQSIHRYAASHTLELQPFPALPDELKKEHIIWLSRPFSCVVTGLEVTSAGVLRHPKIVKLPPDVL